MVGAILLSCDLMAFSGGDLREDWLLGDRNNRIIVELILFYLYRRISGRLGND
jgi:hypothetical protein